MRPYYEILEVDESASQEEIKKSYRKLSKKWHPDKHQDPLKKLEAETRQQAISEAYSTLGKTEKRVIYDQLGISCPLSKIEDMANQAVLEIFRQIMKSHFKIDRLFITAQEVSESAIERIKESTISIESRIKFLRSVVQEKVEGKMEHLQRAIREEIQDLEMKVEKLNMDCAIQNKTLEMLKKDYTKEEVEQFFTITMGTTGAGNFGQW